MQETKSQEITPINNKSATPATQEEQTALATDTNNLEDVSTNAENKIQRIVESIPDKPGTGKILVLLFQLLFSVLFFSLFFENDACVTNSNQIISVLCFICRILLW